MKLLSIATLLVTMTSISAQHDLRATSLTKGRFLRGSKGSSSKGSIRGLASGLTTSYFEPFIPQAQALVAREKQLAANKADEGRMWWQDELLEAPRTGDPVVDDTLLYLEILMQNAEESRHTTSAMQTQLNSMHEKTFKEKTAGELSADVAKNSLEVVTAVFGAMDKLQSGDTNQIVVGSMEIVSAVGKFVPGMGPFIQLTAGIIGGIFGLNQEVPVVESTESIVDRVIKEALADARDKELQDKFIGMLGVIRNDNAFLESQLLVHPDTRTEQETEDLRLFLTNGNYGYNSGVQLMGELLSYIERDLLTTNEKDADRIAGQMLAFVNLQMLRDRQMCALSLLWATLENNSIMNSMFQVIESEHQFTAVELHALSLEPYGNNMPRNVVSSLHTKLSTDERSQVELFMDRIGNAIPGVTVRVVSNHQAVACIVPTGLRLTLTTKSCDQASSLFRLYGVPHSFNLLSVETKSFYSQIWHRTSQTSTGAWMEVVQEHVTGPLAPAYPVGSNGGAFEIRKSHDGWRIARPGFVGDDMRHQGRDNNKSILMSDHSKWSDQWEIVLEDGTSWVESRS